MDLIAGGMTDLQGFLDLFGRWDPSLTFVMGGAILAGSVGFALPRHPATFRTDPSNAIGGGPLSGLLGACRAWGVEARAESLLPGGRGAQLVANETVPPRVR